MTDTDRLIHKMEIVRDYIYHQYNDVLFKLDELFIDKFKSEAGLEIDDIVFVNNHRAKIAGFKVINGVVKPVVFKFKKDKKKKFYISELYSNTYVVQEKDKLTL